MITSLKSEHRWSLHLHRADANVGPHLREVQDTKPVAAHEPGQAAGRCVFGAFFGQEMSIYVRYHMFNFVYIYMYIYILYSIVFLSRSTLAYNSQLFQLLHFLGTFGWENIKESTTSGSSVQMDVKSCMHLIVVGQHEQSNLPYQITTISKIGIHLLAHK